MLFLSGNDISLLANFHNLVGTGHGPQDLVSSSELINYVISFLWISWRSQEGMWNSWWKVDFRSIRAFRFRDFIISRSNISEV